MKVTASQPNLQCKPKQLAHVMNLGGFRLVEIIPEPIPNPTSYRHRNTNSLLFLVTKRVHGR
jgi:hypothetical protein